MSRLVRPRVSRPRSDEELSGWETAHLLMDGHVAAHDHPWPLDGQEEVELADDHKAAMARKKPVGFAPWPEDE